MDRNLVLTWHEGDGAVSCAACEKRFEPSPHGWEIALRESMALVCDDCAREKASALLEARAAANAEESGGMTFCPSCGGGGNGCLNVSREHYGTCRRCMVRWWVGSNLFSGWRDETHEDWEKNIETLAGYKPFKEDRSDPAVPIPVGAGEDVIPF